MREQTILGGVLFTTAYCLMGVLSALSKYLQLEGGFRPSQITFFNFSIVALLLLPWVIRNGGPKALKTSHFPLILFRAVLGFSLFIALFVTSHKLPIVTAVTFFNTAPLWVPVWAMILLKEQLSPKAALCIAGGFIGMVLIMHPRLQGMQLMWDAVGLSAGLLMALVIVIMRKLRDEPWQRVVFYYTVIAAILSAFFMARVFKMPQGKEWLVFLAMGGCMYLIQWLATVALHHARAIALAPLTYSSIIVSGIIGWLVWGHIPTLLTAVGTSIIIISGIFIVVFELKQMKQ